MDCNMPGIPVLHYLLSLLKLMSIELVMLSNHHILCHPLLLLNLIQILTLFLLICLPELGWACACLSY